MTEYPYEMKAGPYRRQEIVKGIVSLSAEPKIGHSVRINPGEEPLEIVDIIHENGSEAQPTLCLEEKKTGGVVYASR